MRSGRTFGGGGGGGERAQGYSSSEDDEMTRLKPAANSGTSTSGGSSSGARRTPRTTNYRNHSNSEGATSPNESDNTYAEASLLHNPRPIRYGECNSSLSRRLLHSAESFVCC